MIENMDCHDGDKYCTAYSCNNPVTYRTNFEKYCSTQCKFEDIMESDIEKSEEHIYVIRLRGGDEIWYYVGASGSVEDRLKTHISSPPSTCWMDIELEVVGIEEVIKVDDSESPKFGRKISDRARRLEHKKAMEIAIEKDTTNVIGGK